MAHLILIRHGESLWNAKGVWTGLTDISLSEKGKEEARTAGASLKNTKIDIAFTSALKRAKETLSEIKKTLNLNSLPTIESKALNERDYGYLTGKNKWEIEKEVGDKMFLKIRRGWNTPIKNGETLKDVYERVVPYYQTVISPKLKDGKNVLIVAHGNSLRALVKYLENISDHGVETLEIATGEIYVYEANINGTIISKKKIGAYR
ncbi:MAG: hypothetical protein A3D74_02335 [Candidatus Levybacteria bacterium RIFCSPHIGHO2_02_FULL_37_13]|nr:MAG: hypothetical protein A3D74_02335 [Candidatus Levybacteria bacterium RIFCSPHIGHO2_02_FULL_37_13]OGH29581.1 MAG: hypothetical protein A3E40_04740 [Candidatus Levybacteria bacterium RIFCSPHIGHO2_12_FULL_37_9]OGH39900.1 MAG: hypothetical protein A3B41_02345 [Candidatus Levybacteria bacterium RIFCSPLOWO2_01_FULL_37_26]